jgi:hypothetical protein
MSWIKRWGWVVLALFVIGSLVTWPRESPRAGAPLLAGAQIDPSIRAAIERSCRDCHSESTRYPWYSYVAPVAWLIRRDVSGGRRHLNLTLWSEYPLVRRERLLSDIANQVNEREMPMPIYTWIHSDARLSDAERDAIFRWTQAERQRLIQESIK